MLIQYAPTLQTDFAFDADDLEVPFFSDLDLGEVSLICSTGIGSILHNVRKYQEHECTLMLVSSSAYVQELFALFGCHAVIDDNFFHNWRTLEKRMQSQGLALTE